MMLTAVSSQKMAALKKERQQQVKLVALCCMSLPLSPKQQCIKSLFRPMHMLIAPAQSSIARSGLPITIASDSMGGTVAWLGINVIWCCWLAALILKGNFHVAIAVLCNV